MRRAMLCAVTAGVLLLSAGCSGSIYDNYRQLENMELIRTIGIDSSEEGVSVTLGTGVVTEKTKPLIYSGTAPSVYAAMEMLHMLNTGKEPYYGHVEHILIGEEAAKEGIDGYLDNVLRSTEIREDSNLFIVIGGTAGDAIMESVSKNSSAADTLNFTERHAPLLSAGYVFTCGEVSGKLAKSGTALVQAVSTINSYEQSKEEQKKILIPVGFAIIKDGKMIGYTDQETTMGACILIDKAESATVCVESEGSVYTVDFNKVKIKYKPKYEENELLSLDIDLQVTVNIDEIDGTADILNDKVRLGLEKEISKLVLSAVKKAIISSQEMGADFFGIGGRVEMAAPVKYRKAEQPWEKAYPILSITISAGTEIDKTYEINVPISVSGEEKNGQ